MVLQTKYGPYFLVVGLSYLIKWIHSQIPDCTIHMVNYVPAKIRTRFSWTYASNCIAIKSKETQKTMLFLNLESSVRRSIPPKRVSFQIVCKSKDY